MKIAISGVHGSGKTTILDAILASGKYNNYKICREITRWVKSLGIEINENGDTTTQKLVTYAHVYNVNVFERMISDRSMMDCYVYTKYLWEQGLITDEFMLETVEAYRKTQPKYDIQFIIFPEFELKNDGTRSQNPHFHTRVNELFEEAVDEYEDLTKLVILSGSVQERLEMFNESVLWAEWRNKQ